MTMNQRALGPEGLAKKTIRCDPSGRLRSRSCQQLKPHVAVIGEICQVLRGSHIQNALSFVSRVRKEKSRPSIATAGMVLATMAACPKKRMPEHVNAKSTGKRYSGPLLANSC